MLLQDNLGILLYCLVIIMSQKVIIRYYVAIQQEPQQALEVVSGIQQVCNVKNVQLDIFVQVTELNSKLHAQLDFTNLSLVRRHVLHVQQVTHVQQQGFPLLLLNAMLVNLAMECQVHVLLALQVTTVLIE